MTVKKQYKFRPTCSTTYSEHVMQYSDLYMYSDYVMQKYELNIPMYFNSLTSTLYTDSSLSLTDTTAYAL